jgi:hypothetical protein
VVLFFEPGDESACSLQDHVEIIDSEKQQEPIAGCRTIGARQGGMLMGTPLVEAEQDSSIRIDDLPKVVMGGEGLRLTEQSLVPFEAVRHIAYPDDRPCAFHRIPSAALTTEVFKHPIISVADKSDAAIFLFICTPLSFKAAAFSPSNV